jgi:pimeloyl-ACP methyl ester carboxylesterase
MPFIAVRDINIYYEEHGSREDPPLVVAHGLMGSIAISQRFAERPDALAAKGLHVFAYDARGHGRSGYTTRRSDYRWDALAEDMLAFMRAVGIERASIYGGSMGAGTALTLALAHPDAVEKLILMAPPPFGDEAIKPARRLFGGLSVLFQLFGTRLTSKIVMVFPEARRAERDNPNNSLTSFLAAQRRASIVPAIRGLLADGPQIDASRFPEIEAQALVLTHPDDEIHPLASGEALHDAMPHARLAVAPSATYWLENPEALAHVVSAFVRGETIAAGLPEKVLHEHG